jgi:hypothetical protein
MHTRVASPPPPSFSSSSSSKPHKGRGRVREKVESWITTYLSAGRALFFHNVRHRYNARWVLLPL